jgi:O-antigen ligase
MLSLWMVVLYGVAFFGFSWKYFRHALGLLIILLPTYLLRFSVHNLPSTILEITFGIIFLVWLIRYAREDGKNISAVIKNNKFFFVCLLIFFLASLGGVWVSDMPIKSLGQWRAYFLEPIVLFFMLIGQQQKISIRHVILYLSLSTLSITIYGVIQAITGWGIATPEWTNLATRRVTAFYTSPNAVGLYVAPVIALVFFALLAEYYDSKNKFNFKKISFKTRNMAIFLPIILFALLAILFSKSEGAIIALVVGFAAMFFLLGYKKLVVALVVLGIAVGFAVTPIRRAILFQDQSGKNRLTLWSYTINYVSKSPANFIEGAGIRQFFRKIQKPYYDVKKMERLIYPHNILLNFWSEIGLFGMISFAGMFGYVFYLGIRILKNNLFLGAALLSCLLIIFVQGMVDVPYFKNDLAMLFWIIMSLFFYLPQNYTAVEVEK